MNKYGFRIRKNNFQSFSSYRFLYMLDEIRITGQFRKHIDSIILGHLIKFVVIEQIYHVLRIKG